MINALKNPQMRWQLMSTLQSLADPEFQAMLWRDASWGRSWFEERLVETLFDDLSLDDSPDRQIGTILFNDWELTAVRSVTTAIQVILDHGGAASLPASEFPNSPDFELCPEGTWKDLMVKASEAVMVLASNGMPPLPKASGPWSTP